MRIGVLDRKITIENFTTAKNDHSEDIKTWATFATVWAGYMKKSTRREK